MNFAFAFPREEFFARFSLSRFPPAGLSASIAIALAVFVLVANRHRPINQIWALALFFLALWQGCIAITQLTREIIFLRFAMFFGACSLCACELLKETIVSPWRSLGSRIRRVRIQLVVLALYLFSFTKWCLNPSPNNSQFHDRGPLFWILDAISFIWVFYILIHTIFIVRSKRVSGIARSELIAVIVLLGAGLGTYIVTSRSLVSTAPWAAPTILIVGLSLVTVLLVRDEIFDMRDFFRKGVVLFCIRGLIYLIVGFLAISFIFEFREMAGSIRIAWGIALASVLAALPLFDRKLHNLVDRRFISQDFLEAQAAANTLIEKTQQTGILHAGYVDVLRRWSEGSPAVFLSEEVFIAPWPGQPVPIGLLHHVGEKKWTTPEILDRQGTRQDDLNYLLANQVAAIICFTAQSGERLVAAFKTRISERPFASRELRESHELLRIMQFGLAFARISQKLLGNERLNLYAQYAPQFAHELRNGLYLQNQLLRAIASGRTSDVLPSDAKAGLERIEQVDRLCTHFLNIRTLYDRPIQAIDIYDALSKSVDEAVLHFATEARVVFRTSIRTPKNISALANPDLFNMAMHNILKNGVEALTTIAEPRWIEITAALHLEKIHLFVRDNGPGLPEERQGDPFTPAMSHKRKGMGLGLSIARDCIEAVGGTIGVRSSNASGTCFEITLNCAKS